MIRPGTWKDTREARRKALDPDTLDVSRSDYEELLVRECIVGLEGWEREDGSPIDTKAWADDAEQKDKDLDAVFESLGLVEGAVAFSRLQVVAYANVKEVQSALGNLTELSSESSSEATPASTPPTTCEAGASSEIKSSGRSQVGAKTDGKSPEPSPKLSSKHT